MAGRSRVGIAVFAFAIAAALAAWNPIAAPFGLVVGVISAILAGRALATGAAARGWAGAALAVAIVAAAGSAVVLALTAGVGRDLGGEPIVTTKPPGEVEAELGAAAERTGAVRERARNELRSVSPAPEKPGSAAETGRPSGAKTPAARGR